MPIEISAGAVVFRRKNKTALYLLLKKENNVWDFPRGLIEKGEKLEQTAKREIKEETGINDLTFIPGFKKKIRFFYRFKGKTIFKTVYYFLAETKTETVTVSFEHEDYGWFDFSSAMQKLSFENTKKVLEEAHLFLLANNYF